MKQKFTVSHAVVARSRESRRSQQGHAPPRGSRRRRLPPSPAPSGSWPVAASLPASASHGLPPEPASLLSAVYGTHVSLDLRAPWPIQDDLTQTHFCKTPFFHVRSQRGCRWTWLRGTPPLNPPQPLSEAFSKQMSVFSFIRVILYSEKQIFPATPPRGGASQSVVRPTALASPGSWVEMQFPGPRQPRRTGAWPRGPAVCVGGPW